jgi:hypothetical protein
MEQLSRLLRQTLNLLKQGNTPGQLGLGEDARQPGCEGLIMLLYMRWCRTGLLRSEVRRPSDELATIGFGISHARTLVASNLPPDLGELAAQDQDIEDLRNDLLSHTQPILEWAAGSLEKWSILNQSTSGFRCALRAPVGATRVLHNQLLAVQLMGGKPYVIGCVKWLRVDEHEEIQCGVRIFPGIPQVAMVRLAGHAPVDLKEFELAMLLPDMASPVTPASIVLPAGWFESGQSIEFKDGPNHFGRLRSLLECGSDFDRGTYACV